MVSAKNIADRRAVEATDWTTACSRSKSTFATTWGSAYHSCPAQCRATLYCTDHRDAVVEFQMDVGPIGFLQQAAATSTLFSRKSAAPRAKLLPSCENDAFYLYIALISRASTEKPALIFPLGKGMYTIPAMFVGMLIPSSCNRHTFARPYLP